MKTRKAWQSFLTVVAALAVVSGSFSPAVAVQPSTQNSTMAVSQFATSIATTSPTTATKKATVVWKNLDRTIHRRDTLTGLTGKVVYSAPQGATGDVVIMVSHQRPGSKRWDEIGSAYFEGSRTSYTLPFMDWHQNLASGHMKYRVTVSVAGNRTKVTVPAGFTVDYNKKTTTISKPKLAGKTLKTDSLHPFKVTGKVNGYDTRVVGVQRYDSKRKRWVIEDTNYATPGKNFSLSIPSTKKTGKYRIFAFPDLTHKAYYGKTTTVKRTSPKASVPYLAVQKRKVAPWVKNRAELFVNTRHIYGEKYPKVTLQEKVKGKWKNVKTVRNFGWISMTLPKGNVKTKDTTKTYRFTVGALSHANGTATKSFKVKWDNPRR